MPDGRQIVCSRKFVAGGRTEGVIRVMNADGSHPIRLTNHPAWDGWASFVRLPNDKSKPAGPLPAAIVVVPGEDLILAGDAALGRAFAPAAPITVRA